MLDGLQITLEYREDNRLLSNRYLFPIETLKQLYIDDEEEAIAKVAYHLYKEIRMKLEHDKNCNNRQMP